MDDVQKDQNEEQRLQQNQGANPASGPAPVGQTNLSADYSAVDAGQQDDTANIDQQSVGAEEQTGIVADESDSNQGAEIIDQAPTEQNEDEGLMNDFSEEHIDDEIDSGDEEEISDEDEDVDEVEDTEDTGDQTEGGAVVGDGGDLAAVPGDGSEVGGVDQGPGSTVDGDSGQASEIPAPDLTPETDATPVEEAIDGAFADFNSGNADAGDVLSSGVDD